MRENLSTRERWALFHQEWRLLAHECQCGQDWQALFAKMEQTYPVSWCGLLDIYNYDLMSMGLSAKQRKVELCIRFRRHLRRS